MVRLSTEAWSRARKGSAPRGRGTWTFDAEGATTGRRKAKEVSWTLETDGSFPEARERALARAREVFGTTANITVELRP